MRHFSLKRNGFANRAFALLLAATLSPLSVPAQAQEGSLDDMWQENQEQAKPAEGSNPSTEASTEKPKKSKKTKKPKGMQPPVADGDLLKSTDKPASGWDSPGTQETNGGDQDLKKCDGGTPVDTSSTDANAGTASSPSTTSGSETSAADSISTPASTPPVSTPTAVSTPVSPSSKASSGRSSTSSKSSSSKTRPSSTSARESTSTGSNSSVTKVPETSPPPATESVPTKIETATSAESPASKLDGPMAPLCKLTSLKSSDLVTSGGWPGVGPFAQDQADSGALVDESKNRLKLKLSGEDVTHAELLLVNQSPKPSQLLALQMNADYLLEAVGALPGKIADFNNDMLKNQDKLTSTNPESVNLKAGTYVVQIQRKPSQDATVPGNVSFLIALDNQKPTIVASATPKTDSTSFSVYSTPSSHDPVPSTTPTTTAATPKTTTTTATTPPAPKSDDLLHKQFVNLINSWQQMKRAAVKTRQSASLSRILGGAALATQNRAIEWLIENKRYYEMTPLELKVLNYKELTPGSKYEIETFIKERRQLVSADTMKVEKDTTQAYNVVYILEKIRGAWLITDTRMVKP